MYQLGMQDAFADYMRGIPNLYLWLMVFSLAGPLALSFDKKVAFFRTYWPDLKWGIFIAAAFFIIWDSMFVRLEVWSFNYDYLLGPRLIGLPLEEIAFFFVIPYACVFVYACYKAYNTPKMGPRTVQVITIGLLVLLPAVGFLYYSHLYTSVTFLLTTLVLALHLQVFGARHLGHIYVGWLVCLLPFFLVNGALTAVPVVIYNDAHNLGIRLYSIPIEDAIYGFLLYLIAISIMEYRRDGRASGLKG